MVKAVLCGPLNSEEFNELDVPFRDETLRLKYGAREAGMVTVSFPDLHPAKLWLKEVMASLNPETDIPPGWTYITDDGLLLRRGLAVIEIEVVH